MRYEMSNLIKDITVTHCAQHFLGVRVGNGVLELSANRAAPSTFERYRCYIVCDTHPSFMALLFAISPSRIRTLRMTAVFQSSLATKNLRSISRLMSG